MSNVYTLADIENALRDAENSISVDTPINIEVPKTCPYTFAAKTVGEALLYILNNRRAYYDRPTSYFFSWDVKANIDIDKTKGGDCPAWVRRLSRSDDLQQAYMDAQEYYRAEWSSYPGDDQGEWKFAFCGRSGGHLCLEAWRGVTLNDADDVLQYFACENAETIKAFYMGIVCADSDFTPERAKENVEAALEFLFEQWQESIADEKEMIAEVVQSVWGGIHRLAKRHGVEISPAELAIGPNVQIDNVAKEVWRVLHSKINSKV